jgi:hypothetical protein
MAIWESGKEAALNHHQQLRIARESNRNNTSQQHGFHPVIYFFSSCGENPPPHAPGRGYNSLIGFSHTIRHTVIHLPYPTATE